jgi:SNF2 family DNA or RNA helicase
MLDILGDYLNLRKIVFSRLDGSMNYIDRQVDIKLICILNGTVSRD